MRARFFIVFILIGSSLGAGAQELENLRSQREKSLNEIARTDSLLKQTETSRINEAKNLRYLNKKIAEREKVVRAINGEIGYLNKQIRNNEETIGQLRQEIRLLKEDYAKVIYKTYLNRNAYHRAQYILAASDFNQAFKRLKYMQQYTRFRKAQAERIETKTRELEEAIASLEQDKSKKGDLLTSGRKEIATLNNYKILKDKYVKDLQKKERQLKKELEAQRAVFKKLENEISRIIAAATGTEVSAGGMKLTPEMKIISNEFNKNSGRLPWPVTKGVITMGYGLQSYPGLRNGQINNKGVDISTEKDAPVLAVFDGKVKSVVVISTNLKAVLIQHGEYFSVYSNLSAVKVKVGEDVSIRQEIGTVGLSPSGLYDVHLEIWKEKTNLNPEMWLAK